MNEKYSVSLRFIHWLMFILFAIIFVLGFVMVEFKETEPWAMYHFHKSTGVLVFLLVLLRLGFRWTSKAPSAPDEISPGNYRLSQGVIHLLYLLMILVPLSGYALSNMHGHSVDLYGLPLLDIFPKNPILYDLPWLDIFPENPNWEEYSSLAHEYLAYTFLGIFLLHLAGIIKHHIQGIEILRRIT